MFGHRKKMHKKKASRDERKPKKVEHDRITYRRDARGDYRNDDGDILPAIILLSILSNSDDASARDTSSDFTPGGGEFGGGGASGNFDSDSSSSSDSGCGGD